MPPERLASAYLYYDARADDARLCLTVARTAAAHGAVVANHAAVTGLRKGPTARSRGVTVEADGAVDRGARPGRGERRRRVERRGARPRRGHATPTSIRPAKGIHITVPWTKVRNDIAVVIPVPKDKRSLFVVPWGEFTYVGTTDTDYDGPLDDPQCTPDDIAYVLRALNHSVTTGVTEADIVGTWAGLRPLVKPGRRAAPPTCPAATGSRRRPAGSSRVTGGKLTTYRRMAADTVDDVMATARPRRVAAAPSDCALLGAEGYVEPSDGAVDRRPSRRPLRRRDRPPSRRCSTTTRPSPARSCPGSPTCAAEAVYAARHEMALTLDDVLSRRTRARLLARDASVAAAPAVARLLAAELGWDDAECDRPGPRPTPPTWPTSVTPPAWAPALDAALGA